jgi:hypothetical protein
MAERVRRALRSARADTALRGEACGLLDRAVALSALRADGDARLCAARVERR